MADMNSSRVSVTNRLLGSFIATMLHFLAMEEAI